MSHESSQSRRLNRSGNLVDIENSIFMLSGLEELEKLFKEMRENEGKLRESETSNFIDVIDIIIDAFEVYNFDKKKCGRILQVLLSIYCLDEDSSIKLAKYLRYLQFGNGKRSENG